VQIRLGPLTRRQSAGHRALDCLSLARIPTLTHVNLEWSVWPVARWCTRNLRVRLHAAMDLGSEKIRIKVKFVAPVNCYTPWILRLAENSTSPDGHQLVVNESATVQEMIDAIVAGYNKLDVAKEAYNKVLTPMVTTMDRKTNKMTSKPSGWIKNPRNIICYFNNKPVQLTKKVIGYDGKAMDVPQTIEELGIGAQDLVLWQERS